MTGGCAYAVRAAGARGLALSFRFHAYAALILKQTLINGWGPPCAAVFDCANKSRWIFLSHTVQCTPTMIFKQTHTARKNGPRLRDSDAMSGEATDEEPDNSNEKVQSVGRLTSNKFHSTHIKTLHTRMYGVAADEQNICCFPPSAPRPAPLFTNQLHDLPIDVVGNLDNLERRERSASPLEPDLLHSRGSSRWMK